MADVSGGGVSADEVLRLAGGLAGVEQHQSRDDVAFRVRGKGFAYLSDDGETLVVKATRDEQAALVLDNPVAYERSHCSGRFGWVLVRLAHVPPDELAELVTEAWLLTAPRKLTAGRPGVAGG
ncbi:MmcQ/YjbR family DNA-binding protein [Polymorphospora sp. NPDC050346]|uniref:MmcQ/YjbR family DNA-binding protein n=1 Tax=Polymorphospora sp. NPDC050346 TaxID=3155780 RepID=UPI0033CD7572